jgi:hypothetical protein
MSERFKPIKPLPEDSMGEKDPTEKMVEEAKKTPKDAMKRAGKKKGGSVKKNLGGLIGLGADKLLKDSEGARSFTKNLGLGGKLLGSYYDKKADSKDKTTGAEQTKQITAKRMGGMVRGGRAEIKGTRPAKLS